MTELLKVADMASYLRHSGWELLDTGWRGMSVWEHLESGDQVLVPGSDDYTDTRIVSREFLDVLSRVESRSATDIADDVASPLVDSQHFRMMPSDTPSGYVSLTVGTRAVQGVRDLYTFAGRSVAEGHLPNFTGNRSQPVGEMLSRMMLGPSTAGSYILNVRVPLSKPEPGLFGNDGEPLERSTLMLLNDALKEMRAAIHARVELHQTEAFDATVEAGVSANLCRALSELSVSSGRAPFEVGFGWARGLPSGRRSSTVIFPEGSGKILRSAAKRLEQLAVGRPAELTGRISRLIDEPPNDRWRIRVTGILSDVDPETAEHRSLWVRLSESDYERAVRAHGNGQSIRARGVFKLEGRRVELWVQSGNVEVIS